MTYVTESVEQTKEIGFNLAKKLYTGGVRSAYIAMRGEMGVGKTAFTSGFADFFGIGDVKSPTYAIMNRHTGKNAKIYHFDMYRISDEDDLYSTGYDDCISEDAFVIVEWSENIEYAIPKDAIFVEFARLPSGEDDREIKITRCGEEVVL